MSNKWVREGRAYQQFYLQIFMQVYDKALNTCVTSPPPPLSLLKVDLLLYP